MSKKETVKATHATPFNGVFGSHFAYTVQSRDPIFVADNINLYVAIMNHGPAHITLPDRHGGKQMLAAGGLWVMPVVGDLAIGSRNGEPALLEIEFLPKLK
jgi:hypothetical protein